VTTIRIEGVYFRVYPADHQPRHVHGEYAETVAIVNLGEDGSVTLADRADRIFPSNAKRSDVKKILKAAMKHFDMLVATWERMHR
jgi:hypothetical protein